MAEVGVFSAAVLWGALTWGLFSGAGGGSNHGQRIPKGASHAVTR
jgi:hypothetical protein